VNFDPQIITLFKEVRNLLWLNFQVPHAITNMAKDAKRVYPHAVSLMETVRTYGQTLDLVEHNKGIEWLVAEYRNESQRMISKGKRKVEYGASQLIASIEGMNIRWDYFVNQYDAARYVSTADGRDNRHIQFVREFASVISVLQVQPFRLSYNMTPYLLGFRTKPIASSTYTRISSGLSRIWRRVPTRQRLFQN
jgi:hypothetical protein